MKIEDLHNPPVAVLLVVAVGALVMMAVGLVVRFGNNYRRSGI